jgi:hypothetical protein
VWPDSDSVLSTNDVKFLQQATAVKILPPSALFQVVSKNALQCYLSRVVLYLQIGRVPCSISGECGE